MSGPDAGITVVTGDRVGLQERLGIGAAVVVTAGAALTIAGTFRGWVASGHRHRHSYEILSLVDRLGFAPDGPLGWALRSWPLVPLLVTAAAVAACWQRRVVAATSGALGAAFAGITARVVDGGPRDGFVRVLDGPRFTVLGAAVLFAGSALMAVSAFSPLPPWRRRHLRHHQVTGHPRAGELNPTQSQSQSQT